ncbi:MAG: rhodanese-like domain-containing protein [Salinimicrobium sp.]
MKKLIYILLFIFTTAGFAQTKPVIKVITPQNFGKEIQQEDVQLIDVRTPKEYKEGHIEGAKNIDFLADDFLQNFTEKFDKNKPVYLYCRSGNRSAKASEKLQAEGFENIIDLEGGYKAWSVTKEE